MGSKTFEGVRFAAYSQDHPPPHVHAFYAEVEVILALHFAERELRLADRTDRIRPANAKRSDVQRIIDAANRNADEIIALWEAAQP